MCRATPSALVNSVMIRPQPPSPRIIRRKIVSVTPAMGASTVAGAISMSRMRRLAGTVALKFRVVFPSNSITCGLLAFAPEVCLRRIVEACQVGSQCLMRALKESFHQPRHGMRTRLVSREMRPVKPGTPGLLPFHHALLGQAVENGHNRGIGARARGRKRPVNIAHGRLPQ